MSEGRTFNAIGVDGCKGGWFFVRIAPNGQFCWGVVTQFRQIVEKMHGSDRAFVDIPIGLPDGPPDSVNCRRACDEAARKYIGPRRSSVFPAPARAVLDYVDNYTKAKAENKKALGKGLATQAFAIAKKIKEVDCTLRADKNASCGVREVHPEVCFRALAGSELAFGKKTHNGYWERLGILETICASVVDTVRGIQICDQFAGAVAADDVLDAMVAALTATAPKPKTLPVSPCNDSEGLPMEMVYASIEDLDA